MRCVERPAEYVDGLTLTALLRAHGLDAELFDENFVRQNWFKILAYDGFRVMVPAAQLQPARAVIDEYRAGALALPDAAVDLPSCPHCGHCACNADPKPRRHFFIAFIVAFVIYGPAEAVALSFVPSLHSALLCITLGTFPLFAPAIGRHLLVARYRCPTCDHAFRAMRDESFSSQQARVGAATRESA